MSLLAGETCNMQHAGWMRLTVTIQGPWCSLSSTGSTESAQPSASKMAKTCLASLCAVHVLQSDCLLACRLCWQSRASAPSPKMISAGSSAPHSLMATLIDTGIASSPSRVSLQKRASESLTFPLKRTLCYF